MKNYTFDKKIDVLHKDKSTTEITKMHKDFPIICSGLSCTKIDPSFH